MPNQAPATFLPAIRQDIREIVLWGEEHFGVAAADRYVALIRQALRDVQAAPLRPGAKARPDLAQNAYVYHLAFSRKRVAGDGVKHQDTLCCTASPEARWSSPASCMTAETWRSTYPRSTAMQTKFDEQVIVSGALELREETIDCVQFFLDPASDVSPDVAVKTTMDSRGDW